MKKHINVFGTLISVINPKKQIELIHNMIHDNKSHYITYSNVHVVVEAKESIELRDAVNNADIASPDGTPLFLLGLLNGERTMRRCAGPDMFIKLLKLSEELNYTNYFYGSTPGNLELLKETIVKMYPKILISGMFSPPFRDLSGEEDEEIVKEINSLSPDLIWVGLGAPKQEIWMYNHQHRIQRGVMLGVGAAFNFISGDLKRAPVFVQKIGFEWLYRLIKEPKRLWKRYLRTNSLFFYYLLQETFTRKK